MLLGGGPVHVAVLGVELQAPVEDDGGHVGGGDGLRVEERGPHLAGVGIRERIVLLGPDGAEHVRGDSREHVLRFRSPQERLSTRRISWSPARSGDTVTRGLHEDEYSPKRWTVVSGDTREVGTTVI